ncbi:DUF3325 domain-containing protein [Alteromonadales bacterium alter-6D02]|uniref:DUF3325 domain-containing protein n=1 Tax=Psychrobium sp. 1_MG-2023 TaxID=3062624 RepID=UPI000C345F0B|nr:hypothetical protein CW748_03400 [Alteromonadales bacterium alter-6D02]
MFYCSSSQAKANRSFRVSNISTRKNNSYTSHKTNGENLMISLLCFCIVAMSNFSLVLTKHRKETIPQNITLPNTAYLKASAWLITMLSLVVSVIQFGWSIGPSAFFGCLTIAVLVVVLTLTYQARYLLHITLISAIVGVIELLL